jgi:hypothetical protein
VLGPDKRAAHDSARDEARATFDDHHGYPDEPHAHRDERDRNEHRRRHRDDERDRNEHRRRGDSRRERRDERDRDPDARRSSSRRDETRDAATEFDVPERAVAPRASSDNVGSKDVMSLMDNTLWNRTMKDVTLDVVDLLVRQIYAGIRSYVVQSVELKFNCFFLMPLMNEFAGFLRQEMEAQFEDSLDSVFDVRSVRVALEERQRKLESELEQMERIQEKFASIHNQLELQSRGSPATAAAAPEARQSLGGFQTAAEREIDATAVAMRASQEMAAEIKRANAEFAHHSPAKSKSHASFGSPAGKRAPLGERNY